MLFLKISYNELCRHENPQQFENAEKSLTRAHLSSLSRNVMRQKMRDLPVGHTVVNELKYSSKCPNFVRLTGLQSDMSTSLEVCDALSLKGNVLYLI